MLIPFEELFPRHNVKPDGILHCGANDGGERETYHKLGIPQVIWVEAIPAVYLKLKSNLQGFPGQRALLACVSDKDGEKVKFNIANNDGQSSSLFEFGTHSTEHPTVKFTNSIQMRTRRVDTLLADYGIELKGQWLLNADLQGAELLAMKGMGDLLQNHFKWAYLEVNARELYKGCPLVGEIDEWMLGKGFRGVEEHMTNSGWGDKMYVRKTFDNENTSADL